MRARINPVADFNDAGLMLQAAEQNLGLVMAREILAADALRDGRLVRLSAVSMQEEGTYAYWLAFLPNLRDWPPLAALRDWLLAELAQSQQQVDGVRETAPAGRSGSRSRAASAAPARRRAR